MLAQIIPLLSRMSYQELKDFIDYCEFYHLAQLAPEKEQKFFMKFPRNRRSGMATGGLPNIFNDFLQPKNLLEMSSNEQQEAYELLEDCKEEELILLFGKPNREGRDKTGASWGAIAWALLKEKAPVRHESRGNIQIKWISYKQAIRDENGKATGEYRTIRAPYLYYRYWVIRGASENDEKGKSATRHKSLYIGGQAVGIPERKRGGYPYAPLAHLVWETLEANRNEKGKRQANSPLVKLESLILACIDISQESPIIDHEKLLQLQAELCQVDSQE